MLDGPMSVLHISESDAGGGAAKSARSLHESLRERGVDSRMLVGRRLTADPAVRAIKRSAMWRVADRPFGDVTQRVGLQYAFLPSSFGVVRDPWFRASRVLQLHNLHGSFFAWSALPVLTRRRPTVWWIQDMWPVTGHVAYAYECDRWRTGCGSCPHLGEYPALPRDTSALLWKLKRAAYERSVLTVVASSQWLLRVLAASPLLGRFPRRLIPNGVDLDRFRPRPQREALADLGFEQVDGPVVLVFDGERRKGAELLGDILARLDRQLTVLVAGSRGDWRPSEGVRVVDLGRIADDDRLAAAYAAADVFLLPTLADNLPNSVLESIACGTPVVATPVGGLTDAVREGETGFVAEAVDPAAIAAALERALDAADLGPRARAVAEAEYADSLQAKRFADLYAELGSGSPGA
jgi:glycosyltransferase involved in cell wall biosynthesis